jgi:hypothetical protein
MSVEAGTRTEPIQFKHVVEAASWVEGTRWSRLIVETPFPYGVWQVEAEIPIHTRSTTLRIRRGFQGLGRSS